MTTHDYARPPFFLGFGDCGIEDSGILGFGIRGSGDWGIGDSGIGHSGIRRLGIRGLGDWGLRHWGLGDWGFGDWGFGHLGFGDWGILAKSNYVRQSSLSLFWPASVFLLFRRNQVPVLLDIIQFIFDFSELDNDPESHQKSGPQVFSQ